MGECIPIPALVFKIWGRELFVRALAADVRPSAETRQCCNKATSEHLPISSPGAPASLNLRLALQKSLSGKNGVMWSNSCCRIDRHLPTSQEKSGKKRSTLFRTRWLQ